MNFKIKSCLYYRNNKGISAINNGKNLLFFGFALSAVIILLKITSVNESEFISEVKNRIDMIKNDYYLHKMLIYEKKVLDFYTEIIGDKTIAAVIVKYSKQNDLDKSLFTALIKTESGFDAYAVNFNANGSIDRGLCQLNSSSFADFLPSEFFDPVINIENGAKYFKWCLDKAGNNTVKALAYYNAGFGAVNKKDVGEHTLNYINKVLNEKMIIDLLYNKQFGNKKNKERS